MRPNSILTAALAMGVTALLAGAGTARAGDKADPKDLFVKNKCNSCHSVSSQNISVVQDDADKGEDDDADAPKPPDLSDVGLKQDADWIKQWLSKKVELHGHKHRKLWEGKSSDLDVLAAWLASQKTPPPKKG